MAELQRMVDVCCQELEAANLKLNVNKSCCLRVGKRCYAKCSGIFTSCGVIRWVNEAKYLGLTLMNAIRFKISFTETKCKFYYSFNAI